MTKFKLSTEFELPITGTDYKDTLGWAIEYVFAQLNRAHCHDIERICEMVVSKEPECRIEQATDEAEFLKNVKTNFKLELID